MASPERRPRVAWVAVSPTPYHMPLFEFLHQTGRLEIHFFFCSCQNASRPWLLEYADELNIAAPGALKVPFSALGEAPRYLNPGIIKALVEQTWDAVVIAGYAHATMQLAIVCCLLRRIPFILYGDTNLLKRRPWLKRAMKRVFLFPVLRHCSAALGVGALARRYWTSIGIRDDHTFIVPYPCHLDSFSQGLAGGSTARSEMRQQLGIRAGAVAGIFVGRLIRRKGVDLLLDGLAMTDPARRPHLVVAGDGPERAGLEQRSRDCSLPITFAGFRQNHELPALYAASDFFVLPSREEPWGIVVAEAMASGLPVVLSDQVGAAYDLLDDGRNGFLVRRSSVEAWRDALQRCVDEKAKLKVMGMQSRSIMGRWTKEESARQFMRAVDLCLARKDKHRRRSSND